jgi:hypothetical protein
LSLSNCLDFSQYRWYRSGRGNGGGRGRDAYGMNSKRAAVAVSVALTAVVLGGGVAFPAQAQADPGTDFVSTLTNSGLGGIDPSTAESVGQSVCPMLAEPGQNLANVAAQVSDAIGKPLGPATMFTGLAISMFCPAAVTAMANGQSPIAGLPLSLPGF